MKLKAWDRSMFKDRIVKQQTRTSFGGTNRINWSLPGQSLILLFLSDSPRTIMRYHQNQFTTHGAQFTRIITDLYFLYTCTTICAKLHSISSCPPMTVATLWRTPPSPSSPTLNNIRATMSYPSPLRPLQVRRR
jgi:hypothetical protein